MEMRRGPALRADHSRLLLELSREIVSTLDLGDVLARALDAFRRILPFESALIRLLDGDSLVTAATTPAGDDALEVRVPAEGGLAGAVVSSIEPVHIPSVGRDHATDPSVRALATDAPIRSYLGLALADGHGFLGVLELGSTEARAFAPDQIASGVVLAPSLAIAIRNAGGAGGTSSQNPVFDQDFMSLVAHELRTPLAVVLGCAETMAAKAADLDPPVVEDLSRRAVAAGHRLERLIADLFDMSRIRNGTLALVPVPTSLRSIVARAISEAPQALRVVEDLPEGLPLVDVDPNRLVQVLRILFDNAWKHAGEGAEVELRAARAGGGVTVEIADRGPGIGRAAGKVFDAFVQAEDPVTRRVGGLGIGLYLANGLCRLMGAGIEVRERDGGGTVFEISLPVADERPEPSDDPE
ncbi:MAG TPA: ATP-binding protein [Actinomycetota bacterium]|nr:ATP-binding protein [Actinomycetota bacterium]